jgi:hypothetical protein
VADQVLGAELGAVLASGDDDASAAKPQIDWGDPAAREQLVDARAKDVLGCLGVLDGRQLDGAVAEAAVLLATVVGQDLEQGEDGVFRIAGKVAPDRVISTVDPAARHGHKTAARGFDGDKGHAAVDPDSELITATKATPGNAGDPPTSSRACWLRSPPARTTRPARSARRARRHASRRRAPTIPSRPRCMGTAPMAPASSSPPLPAATSTPAAGPSRPALLAGAWPRTASTATSTATPSPVPRRPHRGDPPGHRRRHRLLRPGVRRLPAAGAVHRRRRRAQHPGRPYEDALARVRQRQADPRWQADYRATRPKVERKLGHLMRRNHGGRRARVRGTVRVDADFRLLAAAANLARLAVLGLRFTTTGWAAAAP